MRKNAASCCNGSFETITSAALFTTEARHLGLLEHASWAQQRDDNARQGHPSVGHEREVLRLVALRSKFDPMTRHQDDTPPVPFRGG